MRFDQSTIKEVLAKSDIAAIIGQHVALRKRGNDLVGLCPFHGEKTPSFHVHPDRGFFKCFGCGAGGDVIAFIQKLENTTFPDAVQALARRAGVELEAENPLATRARGERDAIYEANALAAGFFHRMLLESPKAQAARGYCERRGLDAAAIETFKLGYAPEGWDALASELSRAGVDDAIAARAGLLKAGQRGYYDFYRNRLMIPTVSTTGETIAFGGRAIGDEEPKYLNTSSTPVYTKGRHLFALHIARRGVGTGGALIVVEGYLDCIAMHQAGFTNTVASLGTSFTAEQAAELRKYAENVLLCFDADAAGEAATAKSIDTLAVAGLSTKVITMPAGADPDSYLHERGSAAFASLLATAKDAVEFKLDRALDADVTRYKSRSEIARRAMAHIAELSPPEEIDRWRVYVAARLQVNVDDLRNSRFLADRTNFEPRLGQSGARFTRHLPAGLGPASFERDVLAIVVEEPALLLEYGGQIPAHRFIDPVYRRLYATLQERAAEITSPVEIFALFADDEEGRNALVELQSTERSSTARFADHEARRMHLEQYVRRFHKEDCRRRLDEVTREMEDLHSAGATISKELRAEEGKLLQELGKSKVPW